MRVVISALIAVTVIASSCGGSSDEPEDGDSGSPDATAASETQNARRPPGCEVVVYTPPERPAQEGDLCVPETNPTRTAVVLAHGGGALVSAPVRPSRKTTTPWAEFYTQHGLVTFSIDFTQATPPGPTYPTPITDEKNAVQYLRLQADDLGIDADHIIVQGHSGGARMGGNVLVTPDDGYFTALGTWPDVSDAADGFIGFYGGYNGAIGDRRSYDVFYGGPPNSTDPDVRERLGHADSISQAATASGPALLFHGDADKIPVAASQDFADALEASGTDAEVVVVPGGGHSFDKDRGPGGVVLSPAGLDAAEQCLAWIEDHFG